MHEFCHRCGGELPSAEGASAFCPHCGAPQIFLQDYELQTSASDSDTTGALPPPDPRQVDWRAAIRCALLVAAVAGVLSLLAARIEAVSLLSWLWTISASLITLALYQKQRPLAWMDAGVGARIGVVAGLLLVICLAVAGAAGGLVARYGLHDMAGFDAELTQMMHAQIEKAAAANPEGAEIRQFLYTPEARAGMMIAGFAMVSGFLLVLSTLGGAVGGLLRMRRKVSA